jgi:hypothetical protein
MQREFIRLYLDIQLPYYRKAKAAALAAGYAESTAEYAAKKILRNPAIAAEIERIDLERIESGKDMAEMLWDARFEAVRYLLQQMSEGGDLRLIDPEEEMGKGLKNVKGKDSGAERAREINNHNRNVLVARRQAREAAEKVLAYTLGEPEQVIRHKQDKPGEKALAGLSDEDLLEVGRKVKGLLTERMGAPGELVPVHAELPAGREVILPPQESVSSSGS